MGGDCWRQQWALIRRYGIIVRRTPIKSFIRMLAWPCLIIALVIVILNKMLDKSRDMREANLTTWILLAPKLPLLISIFHVYYFGELLVKDRASDFKSLMISSGLSRCNYYCAMSISSLLYLMPISVASAVITKMYLFDEQYSWANLLLVFCLFAIHLDAATAFIVSFIGSPSYTFVIPTLIFFEGSLHTLANSLIKKWGSESQPYVLFTTCISPFEAVRLLYNDYVIDHRSNPNKPIGTDETLLYQKILLIILSQLFWTLCFRLFAYWFEEVDPWRWFAILREKCLCCFHKEEEHHDEHALEAKYVNSKFFEQRSNNLKMVGIQVTKVSKAFKRVPAVSNLSISIYKGETTLLLGHNGAGKSTLMNMILGVLRPDKGRVVIKGGNRTAMGICPQTSILDENLNVRQHLDLFNDIKSNLWSRERELHIKQTLDEMGMTEHASKQPSELSGGMKRKLSLGMAFVGKSEVLILDEPSSGLDPDSRMFIWNAIRRYRTDRTVLLSTQHMEEADYLGDRIAIMSAGRLVCCGTSVFLNNLFGSGYKLRVECRISHRAQILSHIKVHFREAKPIEDEIEGHHLEHNKAPRNDQHADFVIELRSSSSNEASTELHMIELLEDLEKNKDQLGVISYGLKSSSIEDVMLTTSQFFKKEHSESTRLLIAATRDHLDTLAQINKITIAYKNRAAFTARILCALCVKQLHMYRANWFIVLIIKVLMPLLGAYNSVIDLNRPLNMFTYWQNPLHVLLVGHFIYFPVKERVCKFKMMQLGTDMTTLLYWCSWILIDLVATIGIITIVNIFLSFTLEVDVLVSRWHLHGLVSAATLLFCLASMMFCYLLSDILTEARTAYGYMAILFALSTAAYIVVQLIRVALLNDGDLWLQDSTSYLGVALLPGDAYRLFYVGLVTCCYVHSAGSSQTCSSVDCNSSILIAICVMVTQALVYALLLWLVETQRINIEWYLNFRNICCCFYSRPAQIDEITVDDDVERETIRASEAIKMPHDRSTSVVAARLQKSYVKQTPIIRNLSFCVGRGECFGLLGVNGAGKSTTFSALVGEARTDSGRLMANGDYLELGLTKYRQNFSYDPQASPDLSLTPHQALTLMAQLRGVPEGRIETMIVAVLELLDMSQHQHKLDSQLSGGTKRKLALGMSLVGNPSVLALDEPTAGVDPLARRSVWQLLKSVRSQSNASIIISSHAMEECEAICDRISIMARGRLRCVGTFLHLRSKFARGCRLRIQFSSGRSVSRGRDAPGGNSSRRPSDGLTDGAVQELQEMLASSVGPSVFKLADRNISSITFDIIDNRVRRSILFQMMRTFRVRHPNASYTLNDASLEDIFISLAKEQQALERRGQGG